LLNRRVPLRQLWPILSPTVRRKTLQLLSGLIVRHLREPTAEEEVEHDRH
jgi:hypothetical protein